VQGILSAMENVEAIGEAFNIGNPRSTVAIYHLARMVVQLAESSSPIQFVAWDFPDVELRVPDVKKAEKLLGFKATVDLEEGLKRTIDWYREKLNRS
jgi:nucleoside-diphosphate-sugar epimerase